MNTKPPEQCGNMEEIRAEVNAIDREIVRLLGTRLTFVDSAVRFKPDESSITNPDHWDRFFAQRRTWGAEEGYPPEVIESMYRGLYEFTIRRQLELHRQQHGA